MGTPDPSGMVPTNQPSVQVSDDAAGYYTLGAPLVDEKAPTGPINTRWQRRKFENRLVNPANRRKLDVIIVGTGLAGGAAAAFIFVRTSRRCRIRSPRIRGSRPTLWSLPRKRTPIGLSTVPRSLSVVKQMFFSMMIDGYIAEKSHVTTHSYSPGSRLCT